MHPAMRARAHGLYMVRRSSQRELERKRWLRDCEGALRTLMRCLQGNRLGRALRRAFRSSKYTGTEPLAARQGRGTIAPGYPSRCAGQSRARREP